MLIDILRENVKKFEEAEKIREEESYSKFLETFSDYISTMENKLLEASKAGLTTIKYNQPNGYENPYPQYDIMANPEEWEDRYHLYSNNVKNYFIKQHLKAKVIDHIFEISWADDE